MSVTRLKASAAIVLGLLVLIVIAQNTAEVETRVLLWSFTLPRALLLTVTLLAGVVLGLLWSVRLAARRGGAS